MKTPSTTSKRPDFVPSEELELHVNWVRRVANALVRDSDAADDIAQETLVVAMNRAPDPGNPVRPWLGGVLRNVFLHYQRARGRRRNYEGAVELRDDVPTPDDLLETVQLQRTLVDMLEDLSEPIRTTLMLRYYHGMSSAEIARKLGLPASTVRSRLALGLDLLRKRFDELHHGDRDAWKRMLMPLAALPPVALRPALPTAGALHTGAAALVVAAALGLYPATRDAIRGGAQNAWSAWTRDQPGRGSAAGSTSLAALTPGLPQVAQSAVMNARAHDDVATLINGLEVAGPERWANKVCADPRAGVLGDEVDGARPRLLVTPGRLCQLRAARVRPDSILREITEALRARVDAGQSHLFSVEHLSYARAYEAQAAAFTYLVTGDRAYAQRAYQAMQAIYEDRAQDFTPQRAHGLARARTGVGLALTYDWAYHGLSAEQRGQLEQWLDEALDGWVSFQHANLMGDESSYWVAMCRGTELLQMLARGAEDTRAERFAQLRASLQRHVRTAYGSLGMAEEGIVHVARGGLHLLTAAYALRSVGIDDLERAVAARSFWKMAMFAGSNALTSERPRRGHLLQSGISPRVSEEDGWSTLLFRTVPADQLGVYRHFYDRHLGRASARSADERFESGGSGWIWSALYFPEQIPAQDPTPVLGHAISDPEHGAYFFRRSWTDLSDVQVMVLGDHRSHGRGWDVDEAFGLGIAAHGVSFAGGGGPSTKRGWASGLFVDGQPYKRRPDVGAPEFYEADAGGGYVIVDGGSKFRRLGLQSSKRHVRVDLGREQQPTILSTLDLLRATGVHDYAWQLNPGDHLKDDGIAIARTREADRETFTMTAPNGAYLKGWVMHPATATVVVGDPLKVQLSAADADLWIVTAIGKGTPPTAAVAGKGLDARVRIADAQVRFDAAAARVIVERR